MKIITDPRGTGFRFLGLAGSFLIWLGLLLIVLVLIGAMVSVMPGVKLPLAHLLTLFSLFYAIPVILAGHVLHWMVAFWESRERANALLEELARSGGG